MIHDPNNMTHRLSTIIHHLSFVFTASVALFLILSPTTTLASSKTLSVPNTSQAPYGYWGQPWQDTCEEASIVMVDNYYRGITSKKIAKKDAKKQLLQLLEIKNQYYGKSLDEDANKVASLINNFYNWEAHVVAEPTLEMLLAELDNGRPIIIPAYGKALKNIYFRNGGPDYHMLVLSGYDKDKKEFICQEPGLNTRGLDFRYKYDTIMNAMHDFTGKKGQTKNGRKMAVFTQKELIDSALTDKDKDGLNKQEELANKTFPWSKDTDKDGFDDKTEINTGHSPIIPAKKK